MNRIGINLKKGECIVFNDHDDLTKDQLEERLSSLFSINNVAILKTESTSIILRPSDISSISIETVEDQSKPPQVEVNPLPKKEPAEAIDIITDID
jgi:hypothetical protein